MRKILSVIIVLQMALVMPAHAQQLLEGTKDTTVTLITHEAAPWMAEELPDQGAMFYAFRKILKKKNYKLKVIFAPSWIRAKMDALKNPEVDGYAPVRTVENEKVFDFSEVIFSSPWSIAERKDKPIPFNDLKDLKKYTAGNVQGVELRPGIEELTKQGLRIEETSTQLNNMLKLATGRVDFIFVDKGVYRYSMAMEPALQNYRHKMQLNPKPIVIEGYKIAFKKNVAKELIPLMNASKEDFSKYVEEYFVMLESKQLHLN